MSVVGERSGSLEAPIFSVASSIDSRDFIRLPKKNAGHGDEVNIVMIEQGHEYRGQGRLFETAWDCSERSDDADNALRDDVGHGHRTGRDETLIFMDDADDDDDDNNKRSPRCVIVLSDKDDIIGSSQEPYKLDHDSDENEILFYTEELLLPSSSPNRHRPCSFSSVGQQKFMPYTHLHFKDTSVTSSLSDVFSQLSQDSVEYQISLRLTPSPNAHNTERPLEGEELALLPRMSDESTKSSKKDRLSKISRGSKKSSPGSIRRSRWRDSKARSRPRVTTPIETLKKGDRSTQMNRYLTKHKKRLSEDSEGLESYSTGGARDSRLIDQLYSREVVVDDKEEPKRTARGEDTDSSSHSTNNVAASDPLGSILAGMASAAETLHQFLVPEHFHSESRFDYRRSCSFSSTSSFSEVVPSCTTTRTETDQRKRHLRLQSLTSPSPPTTPSSACSRTESSTQSGLHDIASKAFNCSMPSSDNKMMDILKWKERIDPTLLMPRQTVYNRIAATLVRDVGNDKTVRSDDPTIKSACKRFSKKADTVHLDQEDGIEISLQEYKEDVVDVFSDVWQLTNSQMSGYSDLIPTTADLEDYPGEEDDIEIKIITDIMNIVDSPARENAEIVPTETQLEEQDHVVANSRPNRMDGETKQLNHLAMPEVLIEHSDDKSAINSVASFVSSTNEQGQSSTKHNHHFPRPFSPRLVGGRWISRLWPQHKNPPPRQRLRYSQRLLDLRQSPQSFS